MIIPMRQMDKDQTGVIRSISAKGELGRRIRDMGLIPGNELMIVGRAPLYDPVAIKMLGFTITLRNSEADYIICEIMNSEC